MTTPQRLPIVGQDDGTWGDIIRQYLKKEHYDDGNIAGSPGNGGHQHITITASDGTAGTAPITMTSGTLLSTPVAGAIEFNTDKLYFTKSTGPTRQTIATYDTGGSTGDMYYRDGSANFTRLPIGASNGMVLNVSSGLPVWTSTLSGVTIDSSNAITVKDGSFTIQNSTTTSKQLMFDLSGITAGQTRTLTVPDATTKLVGMNTVTAKGDLLVATGSNAITNLAVGTNNYVLTADSTQTGGVKWAPVTAGTVTNVSVTSANGFAGSVTNPSTTPAITVSTSVTGLLKGDGTAVTAATAGTDYTSPASTDTFSGAKTFNNGKFILAGSTSGATTVNASAAASGIITLPAATSTLAGLAIAQTWTADQSFNSGNFKLNGATSGTITLNAPAVAGSNTITLPAATDTLVGQATADILTNKTLSSPTLSGAIAGTPTWSSTQSLNTTGTAVGFTGSLAGDVTGTQAATVVGKVNGVAISASAATIASQLSNAQARSATATLAAGEETVFTGSTSGQTLTLPTSPQSSTINTITNIASVSVQLAPGGANTLNYNGATGTITIPVGGSFSLVYISGATTWYVTSYDQLATQGTGSAVYATSPSLTTPNLGTPSSLTLTNATGLPLTGLAAAAYSTTPGASKLAQWDSNSNLSANNTFDGFATTVTSATPVTLTISSAQIQAFTGSTAQTVSLPTTSVPAGAQWRIINDSSATVTVTASGGGTVTILAANTNGLFTALIATPTLNSHWEGQYWGSIIADGKTLAASNSMTLAAGADGQTYTFPSTSGNVIASATAIGTVSGTPSGTTYLRGDGQWATPSSGGSTGITTTVTSATPYTMTSASTSEQVFTGSTAQTVTLPSASVTAGQQWLIINQSTALVTVNASGGTTVVVLAGGTSAVFNAAVATPSVNTDWDAQYGGVAVTSGKSLNVNNSLTLAGTDGTTMTFPSTSSTVFTSASGIPTANLPDGIGNANSALQSQVTVANTAYYITSSELALPATLKTGMAVGTMFRWRVSMTKTAAGTGAFDIIIYRGTNGSTADTADVTQSIGTQTAAVDHAVIDVQLVVTTTGASGAYYWSITPMNKAVTATGFGCVTGTLFSGTKSAVAMNTASLIFGLGFKSVTGTPTITVPLVEARAFNID